jgi:signal transduction histidine kinase
MGAPSSLRLAWRWFLTGWPPGIVPDGRVQATFHRSMQDRATGDLTVGTYVLMTINLVYWPTDDWAFGGDPTLTAAVGAGRIALTALGVGILLAVRLAPTASYVIGTIGACAGLAILAWSLAGCGGPSTPWLYFTFPFLFGGVAAWIRPAVRLGLTTLAACSLAAGYFGTHPEHLADPMARVALAHLAYLVMASWAAGAWFDLLRVRLFLASHDLAAERADLAAKVAEQTLALRALARRTESLRDAERVRLARDLHDDLGQNLSAATLILGHARRIRARDQLDASLDLLESCLTQMHEQTRRLLHDLRPALLGTHGLAEAVQQLCVRAADGTDLRVRCDVEPVRASEEAAVTVWRFVQESLSNAQRHAAAREVTVRLRAEPKRLVAQVTDDGAGFDPASVGAGLGLLGMRERAATLGGDVTIHSAPGRGAALTLSLPVPE